MIIHAWGRQGTESFSCHVGSDVTLDGVVDNFGDYFGQGYCPVAFDPSTAVENAEGVRIQGAGSYRGSVNGVRYFNLPVLADFQIGKQSTTVTIKKLNGEALLSKVVKTNQYEVLESPQV